MKLNHKIGGATWTEETKEWVLKVENLTTGETFEDRCNVLINASGVLKYVFSHTILVSRFLRRQLTRSPQRLASGNGPISQAERLSRAQCSTAQTGMKVSAWRERVSVLSEEAPRRCRLCRISCQVGDLVAREKIFLPQITNQLLVVKDMKCFVRSTSWVTAGFGQRFAGPDGKNFNCECSACELSREKTTNDFVRYR